MNKQVVRMLTMALAQFSLLAIFLLPAQGQTFSKGEPKVEFIGTQRVVRVNNTTGNRGQQVTVQIGVDAAGDEASYGFSLMYDSSILTVPMNGITIGNAGGNVLANPNTVGRIGFSIDFGGGMPNQGTNQVLVNVKFNIAANAPSGQTPLVFTDTPAARKVSDSRAMALTTTFTDGFLSINPTAATATIGGRVLSTNGRGLARVIVVLTDGEGMIRQARTNSFGYFRIGDVSVGETITLDAYAKGYEFTTQVLSVDEDITDLNVIANP